MRVAKKPFCTNNECRTINSNGFQSEWAHSRVRQGTIRGPYTFPNRFSLIVNGHIIVPDKVPFKRGPYTFSNKLPFSGKFWKVRVAKTTCA